MDLGKSKIKDKRDLREKSGKLMIINEQRLCSGMIEKFWWIRRTHQLHRGTCDIKL